MSGAPGAAGAGGASPALASPTPIEDDKIAQVAAPADPYIGTVLGERYRVLSKLGSGGMGAVYLAEHVVIERKVAIKILSQDFAHKADLVQRFIQEARAAARIGHENIVEVYDFGETASGSVFFAMEYLEGQDLAHAIQKGGFLPIARIKNIAGQLCKALSAAHGKKIVHRDLKPENIYLIEREGRTDFVKILDFGIAKMSSVEDGGPEGGGRLTRTGMIFGTPEYMSPEQARGETPDHRVDIYALGCILYEMLTGKVPFQSETFMGTLTKQMFELPVPPSQRARQPIPHELEAVCLRAIEKDRERRFQSMQEFGQALDGEIQVHMPASMQPMQPMQSMPYEQSLSMPGTAMSPMAMVPMPGMNMQPGMYPQQLMQQGMYAMHPGTHPGTQMSPMAGSGAVQMPMQGNISGVVASPMGGSMSGMIASPMMAGMNVQVNGYTTAPPAYEVAQPPGQAQFRRLIFVLVGATVGVVVLLLLLFWPAPDGPVAPPPKAVTQPVQKPPAPAPAPKPTGPARLLVKGLAGSRVFVESSDVGVIPADGQLVYDAPYKGTSEWSVYIKVTKDDHAEWARREFVRAGGSQTVEADQPALPSAPEPPKAPANPAPRRKPAPAPAPAAKPAATGKPAEGGKAASGKPSLKNPFGGGKTF